MNQGENLALKVASERQRIIEGFTLTLGTKIRWKKAARRGPQKTREKQARDNTRVLPA
jgi:hypothetical protein